MATVREPTVPATPSTPQTTANPEPTATTATRGASPLDTADHRTRAVVEESEPGRAATRRTWIVVASALVVATVVLTIMVSSRDAAAPATSDPTGDGAADAAVDPAADAAVDHGTWSTMADAPIAPRPYAVAEWIGDEAVFWAGSNLARNFAHTDGAAYDPSTDTWRLLEVPGWGHPGMTSSAYDGELYVLAKGGGSRFDPVSGEWIDLPPVESMYLAGTVATDVGIWGVGTTDPGGSPTLAVSRYDPATETWHDAPALAPEGLVSGEDGPQLGEERTPLVVDGLVRLEDAPRWTGTEIVLWEPTTGGVAFDPASERWRSMQTPVPPDGELVDSTAVMTDLGLVAIVENERSELSLALADVDGAGVDGADDVGADVDGDGDRGWRWLDLTLPVGDLPRATVAGAGEWVVVLPVDAPPITVHLPTGDWRAHTDGPAGALDRVGAFEAPNTVWTGDRLVVWGGATPPGADDAASVAGAVWVPPAR